MYNDSYSYKIADKRDGKSFIVFFNQFGFNFKRGGKNIIDEEYRKDVIVQVSRICLESRKPDAESIYGNGNAGEKIADVLAGLPNVSAQKCICY